MRRREAAEVFSGLQEVLSAGSRAAVAVVVGVDGSAYRRPGAMLLTAEDGIRAGAISGGCLEDDVRLHAERAMATGEPALLTYDTGSTAVEGLGLGCDGRLRILVRPFDLADVGFAGAALRALRTRDPVVSAWALVGRGVALWVRGTDGALLAAAEAGSPDWSRRAAAAVASDETTALFVEELEPSPRIVLCGAGEDSRPIAALAARCGFDPVLLDHRPARLDASRYPPGSARIRQRPGVLPASLALDSRDAAVVKTHAFEADRDWLAALLATAVGYIGLMGPRSRIDRLRSGLPDDPRIFGPTGLDIGGRGSEQVAVSVVAELIALRAGHGGGHLRDRRQPIHAGE